MNWSRYLVNFFKLFNRAGNVALGGSSEIPLSARAGYWQSIGVHRWTSALINFLYRDDGHCQHAYEMEDDNAVRHTADPDGKFLLPLLVFWLAVIGLTVWVHVPAMAEFWVWVFGVPFG